LATGGRAKLTPYATIEEDQETFIERKYLPPGMVLRKPRTMKEGDITKLFEYIAHRQEVHGAEDAFRFASIKHKNKGPLRAKYPTAVPNVDHSGDSNADQERRPATRVRRRTQSRKASGVLATDKEAGEQVAERRDDTDAGNDDLYKNLTASLVGRRTRSRVVATDQEAEEQHTDRGDNTDAVNDYHLTANRVRHQTRGRKVARAEAADEAAQANANAQAKDDGGTEFDAGNDDQQHDVTAKRVRRRTGSSTATETLPPRSGADAAGVAHNQTPGNGIVEHNLDLGLFPTPAPSPSPMLPTKTGRPKPRARVTPDPRRVQPSRKGKGH